MNSLSALARAYLVAVTALVGIATVGFGTWCLIDPVSFAEVVQFHEHQHFLHDAGAFQLGLGVTLLLALIWGDALATALAGFIVANTVHTVNHVTDLDQGGSAAQAWALGAVSIALLVAFWLRLRQLGYVLGPLPPQPTRRWGRSCGRRQSTSRRIARTALGARALSASWWMASAPTSAASSARSRCAGCGATRASNSARQRHRASRLDPRSPAAYACWRDLSTARLDVCYGRNIPACTACWSRRRTGSCGPSSAARYTRS